MLLGDRIRKLREEAGMTQAELGKLIGVSDRVLGYYETNERFPKKQEVILNLARVFGVSTDYLLGRDGEFIQEVNEQYGEVESTQAQQFLKNAETLFAGGEVIEDDKDEVFRILTKIYIDSKNKQKKKLKINKPAEE